MLPAHFHDVDDDPSDQNVEKILGLSTILTVIICDIVLTYSGITGSLLLCFVHALFSSSDTFAGCSKVVVKNVQNLSDPHELP